MIARYLAQYRENHGMSLKIGVVMVSGELAITLIGAQLAFIALWVATLGADTAGFALGLSLFIGAWILLGIALKDGFDAGVAFNRALGVALGQDYLASLPASRRVKLQHHIHSRDHAEGTKDTWEPLVHAMATQGLVLTQHVDDKGLTRVTLTPQA